MDFYKKRDIFKDTDASAVPLLLFLLTIIVCGALYTLFFLEIAIPLLSYLIPSSDSKTFIMMIIWAMPMIITIVGMISLIKAGQKQTIGGYM